MRTLPLSTIIGSAVLATLAVPASAAVDAVPRANPGYPTVAYGEFATAPLCGGARGVTVVGTSAYVLDDTVYVACTDDDSVAVIRFRWATVQRLGTISVGDAPWGVTVSSDDTVYVANSGSDSVSVISPAQTSGSAAGAVQVGDYPQLLAVGGDDTVYVADFGGHTVSAIAPQRMGGTADDSVLLAGISDGPYGIDTVSGAVYVTTSSGPSGPTYIQRLSDATLDVDDSDALFGSVGANQALQVVDDTIYVKSYDWPGRPVGFPAQAVPLWAIDRTQPTLSIDDTTIVLGGEYSWLSTSPDDTLLATGFTGEQLTMVNGRTGDPIASVTATGYFEGLSLGSNLVGSAGSSSGIRYVADAGVSQLRALAPLRADLSGANARPTPWPRGTEFPFILDSPVGGVEADGNAIVAMEIGGVPVGSYRKDGSGNNIWYATVPSGTPGGAQPVVIALKGNVLDNAVIYAGDLSIEPAPTPPPPPPAPVLPGTPKDVVATAGVLSATVTWQPPGAAGTYPVSEYELRSDPAGATCITTTTTCDVKGLSAGTEYRFSVRALSGAGWGDWSAPSSPVTPRARPSITIVGTRGGGASANIIYIDGDTTLAPGSPVVPRVRFAGQPRYFSGVERLVDAEGEFTWQRKTRKTAYVYFRGEDARSERVVIPAP